MSLLEIVGLIVVLLIVNQFVYDRYIQRHSSLLVSYPVIGRMRYLFEALREPLRQYFADEKFYESRDKIDWVYKASKNEPNFVSFSTSNAPSGSRFILKNASFVLNDSEVSDNFAVTFGKDGRIYKASSPIIRSAMSDGALSPEATRAFTLSAKQGGFLLNTGEGGLTTNHFFGFHMGEAHSECFEKVRGSAFARAVYGLAVKLSNTNTAANIYRAMTLEPKVRETYILHKPSRTFFRPNWNAPVDVFPKDVPGDMAPILFQMGSGLYGIRDKDGRFDADRYKRVMSFCAMSEVKLAQGAKQTGGKIIGAKVTDAVAYYRGVEAGKDLISPNRFPYASSLAELFDFVGTLQELSQKPVGIKIVISDSAQAKEYASFIKERKDAGAAYPDFITIDSGEGGSATAPLELMESVGLNTHESLYLIDKELREAGVRDGIKLISSGKILTPDDMAVVLSLGADAVGIARGFMMSAGCIRARHCSGTGMQCPVGMATQDKGKRASYLVYHNADRAANYHKNLLKGLRTVMAVMGKKSLSELSKQNLAFKDANSEVYFDIDKYFESRLG